jgi:SET domain-containing protein
MTAIATHLILKPSPIDGLGVFTLTPIRQGEPVPLSNEDEARILSEAELASMPSAYSHYCVPDKDEHWWGPVDFHRMSIGWYLNHSHDPNIDVSDRFAALRPIRAGEELTIDYSYWNFAWVHREDVARRPPWFRLFRQE